MCLGLSFHCVLFLYLFFVCIFVYLFVCDSNCFLTHFNHRSFVFFQMYLNPLTNLGEKVFSTIFVS